MDTRGEQLQDDTFDLLAFNHDWVTMSNHTNSDNSLESIHDLVHTLIGGPGHMSSVPIAGFDPIFFLHHTNVGHSILIGASKCRHQTYTHKG